MTLRNKVLPVFNVVGVILILLSLYIILIRTVDSLAISHQSYQNYDEAVCNSVLVDEYSNRNIELVDHCKQKYL